MSEVIWIEAAPRHAGSAAPTTVLLAGGGWDRSYRHPVDGRQFRAGVTRRPLFSARLGFDEGGWNGSTRPQTSVVSFSTADTRLRDALAALVWKDAPVSIDVGPEGVPPTRILIGKIQDVEFTLAGLTLTIIDLSERLEGPIASARFAGNGGIEGPAEAKGRVKRRSFGYVFNVEGRLINAAHSIYEFGDPAYPLTAWNALRDKGRAGSFAVLAWQGSIAATYNALIASNPARGGGVVAPSIACAKWWTQPSGPLTADMIGTAGVGGGMQPAAIAAAISAAAAGPTVNGLPAAVALRDAISGVHVASDTESFAQAIDRVLLGASLLWLPRPNGTIEIAQWTFNAAAPLLQGEFRGRTRTYPPHGTRRIGFQRNERIHSDSEMAGVLLEDLVDDGASIAREDLLNSHQQWTDVQNAAGLRPQDNATFGAAWGLNLTGRPGNLAALGGSEGVRNDLISIGSNGALLGGAGGQVTIGGLGFAGSLTATAGDNLLIHGDLDAGHSGWALGEAMIVTGNAAWPVRNAAYCPPSASGFIVDNQKYLWTPRDTFMSATVYAEQANAGSFHLHCYTAADAFITTITVALTQTAFGSWQRHSVRFPATMFPAGTAKITPWWGCNNSGNAASGVLSGAFRLGVSQDGATLGGAWSSNITGRPTNLAALGGSEGVRNDLISIGSNGALLGGAGGQVTIGGLGFVGDLDAQRLSRLNITAGRLRRDTFDLSSSFIANEYVTLSGVNLTNDGGATTLGAVANVGISIGANGALLGGAGGQVTLLGIDTPGVIGRTALLSAANGRVLNPTFYNTQVLLGPRNATSLTPTYSVGASNVTVNLPAHNRVIAGPSGPLTLSYGATSGVVAFSASWWAYIDDPDLTGFASPTVAFTNSPVNLLHPGRYEVASGTAPAAGGGGGDYGGGGGGGIRFNSDF